MMSKFLSFAGGSPRCARPCATRWRASRRWTRRRARFSSAGRRSRRRRETPPGTLLPSTGFRTPALWGRFCGRRHALACASGAAARLRRRAGTRRWCAASMGAAFRAVPVSMTREAAVASCRASHGARLLATALRADAHDLRERDAFADPPRSSGPEGAGRLPGAAGRGGRHGHHPDAEPLRIARTRPSPRPL